MMGCCWLVNMDIPQLHEQVEQLKNAYEPGRPARKAREALGAAEVAQTLEELINEYDSDEGIQGLDTEEFLEFPGSGTGERRILREQREQIIAKTVEKAERTGAYPSTIVQLLTVQEHERVIGALRAYYARCVAAARPVPETDEPTIEYRAGARDTAPDSPEPEAPTDPFANVTRRRRRRG